MVRGIEPREVREIDRRLIRIETMVEIAQGKSLPGIDILPDIKDGDFG